MRRDFSEEYKETLLRMIRQNEDEKWCDLTDWIGDRLLDFGDWIGILDLYKNTEGIEKYTRLILDKNNTSANKIEQIFTDVQNYDVEYSTTQAYNIQEAVDKYKQFIADMGSIICPDSGRFQPGEINSLIGEVSAFQQLITKLERNTDFSCDVYNLIYDEEGNRRPILEISSDDKDKIIQGFEELHPQYAEYMDEILSSGNPNTLTEDDIRNIKVIAYTAEEPYRSIYLDNVKRYQIGSIGDPEVSGAYYSPSHNSIYFQNNTDCFEGDARGPYTIFFHESGHASDYQQPGYKGAMTETYTTYVSGMTEEVTLQEAIYDDVYNDIEEQIRTLIRNDESVKRILETFEYGNEDTSGLTPIELEARNKVIDYYHNDLRGEVNEAASDVYGGVTNNQISGSYGHRPSDGDYSDYTYWYDSDGNATYAQSRELWAEYFSYCMTGNEAALDSLREHFPSACQVLDSMAEQMKEEIDVSG